MNNISSSTTRHGTSDRSFRNASLTAGVALLIMAVLGPFGIFIQGLVAPGDAAQTATNIVESETLFRLGIASLFLVIALDVVVAWALYRVFRPVSTSLSLLAAWSRLAYSGIFMVAIAQLAGALRLLSSNDYLPVFSAEQLDAQALLRMEMFTHIWDAGFVLFGLHLLVIGFLAYRSGYVPKFLGVLVGIAGFGYAFDSFVAVLVANPPIKLGFFTFIGELLLALWLVIKGRRLTPSESAPHNESDTKSYTSQYPSV